MEIFTKRIKRYSRLILFLFIGMCIVILGGYDKVYASNLKVERIDNVYFVWKGGNVGYDSGQYGIFSIDNKVVYCIEPGKHISTNDYYASNGVATLPFSDEINRKIQLMGYYGYNYPGHQTLKYRMATQALIWETIGGLTAEFWTELYGNGDYIDVSSEKSEILRLIENHNDKPSFDGETLQGGIGQRLVLTDINEVLSDFEVVETTDAIARIEGNNLVITPKVIGDITIYLTKKTYTKDSTVLFAGYDKESQKMAFFGYSDDVTVSIHITSYGGLVTLYKVDSDTFDIVPQGDAKLKGAIYGVYTEDGVRIGEVVIGEDMVGKSDFLPNLGRFYAQEEVPSPGYTVDPTKYYFDITEDELFPFIIVNEKVIERDIELYKTYKDSKTGILKSEPEVIFEFYLKSTMQLYETGVTDSNGRLKVTLPYGTYIVKQVNSQEGYGKVSDFEIVVDSAGDDSIIIELYDPIISAHLKVIKIDSESGQIILRDGIKFRIKNLDTNKYVCQLNTRAHNEDDCIFETRNGYFITPYKLEDGHYQLEEVKDQVIVGYVWNSEPLEFTICDDANYIYDEEYGAILEIKFANNPVKGEVNVNKIGEKLVIENGNYHYEEIQLNNVTYQLYAFEDIYSADGRLIYRANTLIGTYTTNNGNFTISNLYLGKYYLIEVITHDDHVLDSNKQYFSIEFQDSNTPIVSLDITLKNYLKKGRFEFHKKDLATGEALPNTKIQIYSYNENIDDGILIFEGVTDDSGNIVITNLFVGKFYLLESEAPDGYILNTDKILFEIKENGDIIKEEMTNERIPFDIPNTLVQDEIIINIISLLFMFIGLGLFAYGKKNKS